MTPTLNPGNQRTRTYPKSRLAQRGGAAFDQDNCRDGHSREDW